MAECSLGLGGTEAARRLFTKWEGLPRGRTVNFSKRYHVARSIELVCSRARESLEFCEMNSSIMYIREKNEPLSSKYDYNTYLEQINHIFIEQRDKPNRTRWVGVCSVIRCFKITYCSSYARELRLLTGIHFSFASTPYAMHERTFGRIAGLNRVRHLRNHSSPNFTDLNPSRRTIHQKSC